MVCHDASAVTKGVKTWRWPGICWRIQNGDQVKILMFNMEYVMYTET